jgi:hypothetical protein
MNSGINQKSTGVHENSDACLLEMHVPVGSVRQTEYKFKLMLLQSNIAKQRGKVSSVLNEVNITA